jgi:hypothetical protein
MSEIIDPPSAVAAGFLALLPEHKCHLNLLHNQHRVYYESAAEYALRFPESWKDEEAKQRAITTDEIWELQWYPNTPVGFNHVLAPTLAELLELAKDA